MVSEMINGRISAFHPLYVFLFLAFLIRFIVRIGQKAGVLYEKEGSKKIGRAGKGSEKGGKVGGRWRCRIMHDN
jgi:hypothetical protein